MKQPRVLCVSLLLAATLWPAAAHAIGRVLPHHVKDLVAGPRVCTAKGVYTYNASWTPITWDNKPWQRYIVQAHNCVAGPVTCTAQRCTVTATSCRNGAPGPWIAVKADIGVSGSGVRANAVPSSRCV